jgi:flavin reductase (DIM6/NTAB) family NADH-FMN oxidoreductase RutF
MTVGWWSTGRDHCGSPGQSLDEPVQPRHDQDRLIGCANSAEPQGGGPALPGRYRLLTGAPMTRYMKKAFPVSNIRRFLEPGPIVLVSSAWKAEANIMTMGWHMVMGEEPSLIGCYIWDANYSFDMIRRSKECVINVPTVEIASTVVRVGNCSGRDTDKFAKFKLTKVAGEKVNAPLIKECYANFECQVVDTSLSNKYSLFVLEVVKAQAAISPKFPQTIHYRGDGLFMISGPTLSKYRKLFKPDHL